MSAEAPAISVVVPCRNERPTLAACLDALDAQTFPRDRFEILLIDGGSTDGGRELARARGVTVLDDRGRGPSGARNVGILAARGDIVAFTDADCVPAPDWLVRIAEVFAEDPGLGGVGGAIRMSRSTLLSRVEDADALAHYRGYITSNAAYRREVLLEVGGFDETLACAEDYDLVWRVTRAGHRVVHDRRPVVLHDPPEVHDTLVAYLRKQAWYARHDVATYAKAVARALREPAPARAGRIGPSTALAESAGPTACVAALGLGVATLHPSLAVAGVAGAAALAGRRALRCLREGAVAPAEAPALLAVNAARLLARGAGTLAGIAGLAHPRAWKALRPPARVRVAQPSPARAGRGARAASG